MTSRFTYERALRRSDLSAPQRLICFTVATYADLRTGIVPARFTPSVRSLAAATGLNPTTVSRNLPVVVEKGWLGKLAPTAGAARTDHARNSYWLTVPPCVEDTGDLADDIEGAVGAEPTAPDPVGAEPTAPDPVGAEPTSSRQSAHSLDAQSTQPVGGAHTSKSLSLKDQSKSDARVVAAVVEELGAVSGRVIDEEWAERVAKQILGAAAGDVASPVAYVVTAIQRAAADDAVARFLPTPSPGSVRDLQAAADAEPAAPAPAPVMETAPCGHQRVVGADDAFPCFPCEQEARTAAEELQEPPQAPLAAPEPPRLTMHTGTGRTRPGRRQQPPLLTTVPGPAPTAADPDDPLTARLTRHLAARGFAGRTAAAGGTP